MKEVKINNIPSVSEFYKLSGERFEKDHHPHSPKSTFEMSTIAVALFAGIWIIGLLWMTTMIFRWD